MAGRGAVPRNDRADNDNNFNNNNNNNNHRNQRRNFGRRDRAQNFRHQVGDGLMNVFASQRDNALFEGFGSLQNFAEQVGTVMIPTAKDLNITTRGLSQMVTSVYNRVENQLEVRRMAGCTVFMLYRAAMLQYQCKMTQAYMNQNEHRYEVQVLNHGLMQFDLERIVKANPQMLTPISGIINQIGNITASGHRYHVGMMEELNMFNLHAGNLRRYVARISEVTTPLAERRRARDENVLPDAEFGEDAARPILMNPDDIIPAVYGAEQAQDDFNHVHRMLDNVAKRIPQYVGRTNYTSEGALGILVSNVADLNPSQWWTPQILTPPQATLGAIAKCGEYPLTGVISNGLHSRSPFTSSMTLDLTYDVAVNGLLG